jgi:hypothetical protein
MIYFCIKLNNMAKKSQDSTTQKKEAMLDAIEASFGNITQAAQIAGINARTHYRWLKEDEAYEYEVVNVKDISFSKVKESLLEKALKLVNDGNTAVLNQLLRIYFKNLPEEIAVTGRVNDNQKWDMRREEDDE